MISKGYVLIQPGTFLMGSPTDEPGRYNDEIQHQVVITRPFLLKQTPVTQNEWKAVMGNNLSYFQLSDNHPVENASWYDAIAYCNALSQKEGLGHNGYRLPTEAEWEYAARADSTGATYDSLDTIAWYKANSEGHTHPVAQKAPNNWGLYDMLGNVQEWVNDWYGEYPKDPVTDPTGPKTGSARIYRGGSWFNYTQVCRAAYRGRYDPGHRDNSLGFRPARSINPLVLIQKSMPLFRSIGKW